MPALRAETTGNCAGRRERQRNGCRALWSGGDRDYAESCTAKTAASGNAQTDEPTGRRTAHRGAIHDRVFCYVAKRPPKAASSECRTIPAVAVQGSAVRKNRIDRLSAEDF